MHYAKNYSSIITSPLAKVLSYVGKLLNLKGLKLGQILRTDKTGFCRLGHIYVAT